jgi:tRNA threonylcarbamoyl adenosine modification protein YeaZ
VILALDTSTPACTVALFAADGSLFASRDEVIGRGHAERLVPLIAEMLDGHLPSQLLVGVGPGSFTGLRIAIAAAQGLGIGWDVPVCGMSSLALLAAGAPGDGPVAVALSGGHGELFVQQFRRAPLRASSDTLNLPPAEAAELIDAPLVVGTGAEALVLARGSGEAVPLLPSAANALRLPLKLRTLDPKPLYARAPDARPREAA